MNMGAATASRAEQQRRGIKEPRLAKVAVIPASERPGRWRFSSKLKLTDAAWRETRSGSNPELGCSQKSIAGSTPAIGQPFNISWGGRGDESSELSQGNRPSQN